MEDPMVSRRWLIALAVLLAGLSGLLYSIRGSGAPAIATARPAAAPAVAAPAGRGGELALLGLRRELADVRAEVAALGGATPEAVAASSAEADNELSPQEREARDLQRRRREIETLARMIDERPADPAWSPQAERSIRDSFARAQIAGARLHEASCRDAMCRIAVEFDSAGAIRSNVDAVLDLVSWDTAGFASVDTEDPRRYVFYAARTPEQFPRVASGD
jgi:hypothetical protein